MGGHRETPVAADLSLSSLGFHLLSAAFVQPLLTKSEFVGHSFVDFTSGFVLRRPSVYGDAA
jgi:hypothetical protein